MPELPEVEAARRAVRENCIGKKIVKAIVADDSKVIDGVSPRDFESSLISKKIVDVHRKGKIMWIQLDSPPFPSFHFGMAGAIYIKGVAVTQYKRSAVTDTDEWPSKYSKVFIQLDDGLEVSFTDKRRFAKVRLLQNPASVPPISELGPDALLEPMAEDELFKSLSKKKTVIKKILLDQSFISGVGNWIADEVLYQARIHPQQIASEISKEGCVALHNSLKEVIQLSVEVDADFNRFPVDWLCHLRWGKKPGKINGKKIEFIEAGGRTTAYVPELQKLSGDQSTKVKVKPQKRSSKKIKDAAEAESDDEEIAKSEKPKRGKKAQSSAKRPPAKRKSISSGSDEDTGDEEVKEKDDKRVATQKKTRGSAAKKKPSARKKSHGSESDESSDL
uniref:formamidopyrimidine-DNA glycosylase-like isoform X2 n=1 Tax=Erigeron canadensis TaxID=72917 RepID=UPI001CB9208A|nr:formamidopyrimidine-DNA glycosylase-like isoform X2 [Erigeron canadensis]